MYKFLPKLILCSLFLFSTQIGLFAQCSVPYVFTVSSIVDNGEVGGVCSTTITWSYDPANGNNSIVIAYNSGTNKFNNNPGAAIFDGSLTYTNEVTTVEGACGLNVEYAVFSGTGGNGTACGGGIEPIDNALPVEFTSFQAKSMEQSNMLDWTTASEENTMLFSIEKSTTGKKDWNSIGEVRAIGFSSTFQNYSFEDKQPKALNYYRIKTIDFDGYIEYSKIVVLERKDLMSLKFEAYPNPVKNELTLDLSVDQKGPANFTLSNFAGKVVMNDRIEMEKGVNKMQIDMSNLEAGMYFISIQHKTDVFTRKISIVETK